MEKLINIATKIGKKIKTNDIGEIYITLVSDLFFRPLCLSLGGNNTVKLVFLIKAYKDGRELTEMLSRLETELFTFSIIEVSNDDVEESCDNCGGNGQNDCYQCDGRGQVDCEECGGSGEDEEGNTCNLCDGDGTIECDTCNGNGTEECDYCDGTGSTTDDYAADTEVLEFASIEKNIYEQLEILEEYEEIDYGFRRNFKGYTFFFRKYSSTSYNSNIVEEKGSTLFYEVNKEPEFVMNNSRSFPLLDSGLAGLY
jgi:hypothetical protein